MTNMIEMMPTDLYRNGNVETLEGKREKLAALIDRLTGIDGAYATAISPLTLYRSSAISSPTHSVQEPSFCVIAQGSKQVLLGDELYIYDPTHYLLVSVDLPIAGQVIDATPTIPYLSLRLNLDPTQISTLLVEVNAATTGARKAIQANFQRGLVVSQIDLSLMDAVMRLLMLLDHPEDIPVLAPLIQREILYRLLIGEQGRRLCQIAWDSSQTQRIARAIDWIKQHYDKPLQIETIAREVHMSLSGLHHHFKAVTAMSPLQYQKQLRLQEARRLMLGEMLDAATVSYRVGYESPSQFSREYSRLFGAPPLRDIARLKNAPL